MKRFSSQEIKEFVSKPLFNEKILLNKEQSWPKISIVTPSYNQGEFLERTILSVLNQNYPNLEYIIIDGGSTDGSIEIIKKYEGNYNMHWISEPDKGPADGLNKGFAQATGDMLGYLNSDDIYLPGAFNTVANYFSRMPDVDVICGNGYELNEAGKFVRKIFSTKWSVRRYAFGGCNAVQQATFFRRTAFTRTTGFNLINCTCWDGELLVDLSLNGAIFKYVPEFLGGFRIYHGSISGSDRLGQRYLLDSRRIFEKIMGRPPSIHDPILRLTHRFYKILSNLYSTTYKLGQLLSIKGE